MSRAVLFRCRLGLFATTAIVAGVLFLTPTRAQTAEPAAPQADPPQPEATAAALASAQATQLTQLAETGRFTDLMRRLEADFSDVEPDASTRSLLEDLRRHDKNQAAYRQKRREAFKLKLTEIEAALADENLDEALVLAIEAHGLSDEPDALFVHPVVTNTVAKAKATAQQAEADRDWVESASIYRLLNLLYEDQNAYEEELNRVSLHLQMLGLYAPDVLDELYNARAKRLGEEPEEEVDAKIERDDWTFRLKGIDQRILDQALLWSARKHVDRNGYKPMMRGAVERLVLLTQTQGLDETFPAMDDAAKLERFRGYLNRTIARLKNPEERMDRLEAESLIDAILATNEATVGLPDDVIIYEMGEGAMATLDDFSSIIWPVEIETFSRSTLGAFFGVGIQISRRDGRLVVVSPLENTPAQKAGIKAGDIIAIVDGKPTNSWTLNRAVNEITGPEGTEVTIGIERGAQNLEFTLRRARIVIESIRGWEHRSLADGGGWDYWLDRGAGVGYVRLSQFIPQTADDLDAAIAQMQKDQPIRGLILDLRFNPGGLLDASIDVTDRFIDEGPIVSTVDGLGNKTNTDRARRFRTYEDFPVIVLINQGSASASEIVSGALQDYDRAMIIGSRSFGKGSVQDLFGLDNYKARLKLTRQYYMLPLGRIIHRKKGAKTWGIEPDLVVNMTNEQVAEALELRQQADILRDENQPEQPADQADPVDPAEAPITARTILERSADPQLEAALLVLKTRQLAGRLVAADPDGLQAFLEGK